MKIFYVHHALRDIGNPPSQTDDIKPLGVKDAKIVAEIFSEANKNKQNIKAIYTSPYLRCLKTAQLINEKLNVPLITDDRLNEYTQVHKLVNGEVIKTHNETWEQCQRRIIELLSEIINKFNDNDIVICVTSGVNITAFISVAYGVKPSNNLPYPLVPSCSPIGFEITKNNFKEI